ncbi:MAG: MBL fold metallo-hydrolase, partial [Lachnospiraceae bacterium]|nr:MBL fold metallo-hydrolase [Lachnospiraceae bacterium]
GKAMLIDAGDNSKGTTVQMYLQKQGIKKLDYLVLTHPDSDHIGGADVIVTKFDVDTVFMTDFKKDNKTYDDLVRALKGKNLKWSTPTVGNTYRLGNAEFTIVAPNTMYDDPNNASIGLLLTNGNNVFLFTGDAEEEAEYDILANGLSIDCDVFKAGHHGSSTSNTKDFVEAASPEYVVISCEKDNSYGHPHAEPMNLFRSMGVKLFRTDEQGSIIAVSDGNEITWNCAPADSWKAGERHN